MHTADTFNVLNFENRKIYIPQSDLDLFKKVFNYDLTEENCANYVYSKLGHDPKVQMASLTDMELSAFTRMSIYEDLAIHL